MNENVRLRALSSILIKTAVIVLTVVSITSFFTVGGEGNMQVLGAVCFRYYTILSNMFSALFALITLPVHFKELFTGKNRKTKWVTGMDLVSANVITVTLLVVLCFLGPVAGYGAMFEGVNLFMHLITPLLVLAAYFIRPKEKLPFGLCFICALPTFCYGILYFFQVLVAPQWGLPGWPDFYFFNAAGLWYVFAVVIVGGAFGLAVLLRLFKNKA